jgi:outer membrane lipoprotein-sorting protein
MLPNLLLLLMPPAITLPPPQAPAPQTPSIDQLIARNIEARGGLAALRAVQTRRSTGVMSGVAPFDIPFTIEQKRPGFFRRDLTIQGTAQIMVFDGKGGWKVDPFATGDAKPQPLTPDEVEDLIEDADMDGCLVDWAAKGDKVEYAGEDTLVGGPAYKLKVTFANGRVSTIFLDAKSYQEVKRIVTRKQMGQDVEMEVFTGDYRPIQGVSEPFSIDIAPKGSPQRMHLAMQKVEVNVPIDGADFHLPAPR